MQKILLFFLSIGILLFYSCNRKPKETLAPDPGSIKDEVVLDTSAFEEIPMDNGMPRDTFPELYRKIMMGMSELNEINGYDPKHPEIKPKATDKEKYSKLLTTLTGHVDSLSRMNDPNRNDYLSDIWFTAEYYGLKQVMEHVKKLLGKSPVPWPRSQEIVIDSLQFKNLKALMRLGSSNSLVYSRTFEAYTLSRFDSSLRIPSAFYEFGNHLYKYQRGVKDTLVVMMPEKMGTEQIRHVFTVWKKANGKYMFITLLDKYLTESQGYCSIDSIYNIGRGSYLMTGRSLGGNQGDKFGSLWAGIWKKPGKFNMIYFDHWTDPGNDEVCNTFTYQYSFNRKTKNLSVSKITVQFDCADRRRIIHSDTLHWNVDVIKLQSKDLTREFNAIRF